MLAALLILAVALIALEMASAWAPPGTARRVGACLCLFGMVIAAASLVAGTSTRAFAGPQAELDGLAGWMLIAVLAGAGAALLAEQARASPVGPALLVLLAGGAPLLVLGLALVVASSRPRSVWLAGWGVCSGLAALTLAVHAGPGFDAMRGAAPDGVLAAVVLLLTLAAQGALFGAVLRGEAQTWLTWLGVALLARISLDLCGPATPVWWGMLVAGLGLATAVFASWTACVASSSGPVLARSAVFAAGLACTALGIALAARGSDLPSLAAMGLAAALLQVLAQAFSVAVLALCARLMGRPGRQWVAPASASIAAASLSALPPFAGFAAFLLLLQALFAACRIGGAWLQIGCAFAVAAAGLSAALASVAMLRLLGFGMLGRGGTALATAGPDIELGTAMLAGCSLALAMGPGLALLAAEPVLQRLVAGTLTEVSLSAPALVAAALVVACAGVRWLAWSGAEGRVVPAWQGSDPGTAALEPYGPQLLAVGFPRIERRAPSLREWLTAAAALLAIALIVLVAR